MEKPVHIMPHLLSGNPGPLPFKLPDGTKEGFADVDEVRPKHAEPSDDEMTGESRLLPFKLPGLDLNAPMPADAKDANALRMEHCDAEPPGLRPVGAALVGDCPPPEAGLVPVNRNDRVSHATQPQVSHANSCEGQLPEALEASEHGGEEGFPLGESCHLYPKPQK